MYALTSTAATAKPQGSQAAQWGKAFLISAFWVALAMVLLPGLAHATGTGTGTGTGGAGAAQARINTVTIGWQNIIQGIGVAVLIIAWSYIGYQIAFAGKTMKDMTPTALGTTVAGAAPLFVGWMFS